MKQKGPLTGSTSRGAIPSNQPNNSRPHDAAVEETVALHGQESRIYVRVGKDPLIERLSHLEWPKAPTELRERCWREISRRMELDQSRPMGPLGESSAHEG